jgi:hypothetical protein
MPHPFHISTLVTRRNIAADGVQVVDLGVQPLSVLLLKLRCLNDTGTLANWANGFRLAQAVNRLTILYRGQGIISMRGEDIMALNYYRWGLVPQLGNPDNTNDETRSLVLPVIMGRYPFMPSSCFPAVGKGELTMELDLDDADTGYTDLEFSVDAVEMPNASPKEYERRIQQTATWPATGQQDLDLPVGNRIRGLLLWGTTGFVGATPAPSFSDVTILSDNQEAGFRAVEWDTLQTLHMLWGRLPLPVTEDNHVHNTTVDGNAQTAVATLSGGGHNPATGSYYNYSFVDYDPTGDDKYALETSSAKRLQIRATAATADAVRVIPIERITT